MHRPQFTLRALLVLMLVVCAFLGGIHIGRQRQKADDEVAALAAEQDRLALDRVIGYYSSSFSAAGEGLRALLENQARQDAEAAE
jgi:hypothetical protein